MKTLLNLSAKQQLRLVVAISVLFVAIGLWMGVAPGWIEYQNKHSELESLIGQLPPERKRTQSLGQLLRSIATMRTDLDTQRARFPISENVSTMLVGLQQILSGSEISRFYPTKLEEVKLAGLSESDVKVMQQRVLVQADGDFYALRNFLEKLEGFKNPVQVRTLEIGRPKAEEGKPDDGKLELTVNLSAYLLDKPVGNPTAAQKSIDDLVAELQAEVQPEPPVAIMPRLEPLPEPPPIPLPNPIKLPPVAIAPPPIPTLPEPTNELAKWRVVGILTVDESGRKGQGDVRGGSTVMIRVGRATVAVGRGDEVENGWIVQRIDVDARARYAKVRLRKGLAFRELEYQENE